MLKQILLSVTITLIISAMFGLIYAQTEYGFIKPALVAFLLQIVIGWVVNTILESRAAINLEKIANERIESLAKQSLRLTCPCTRQVQEDVPLRFDKDNIYECAVCNKNIVVRMDVKTALITDMIDVSTQHETITKQMHDIAEAEIEKSVEKETNE